MPLLAEGGDNWGAAGAVLAVVSTGLSLLFAYLNKRAQLRHDTEMALLKAQNAECEKGRKEDAVEIQAARDEASKARTESVQARTDLARLEGRCAAAEKTLVDTQAELRETRGELRELRDRLNGEPT